MQKLYRNNFSIFFTLLETHEAQNIHNSNHVSVLFNVLHAGNLCSINIVFILHFSLFLSCKTQFYFTIP
jgi:hypothetical protein